MVLKSSDTHGAPRRLPPNRFSPAQPQAKTNSVPVLSAHRFTSARYIQQQCQPGSEALTKRLPLAHKNVGDDRLPGGLRHFERCRALVDARAHLGIRATVE